MFESEQDLKIIASSLYLAVKDTESESVEGENVHEIQSLLQNTLTKQKLLKAAKYRSSEHRLSALHGATCGRKVEETRQDK